MFGIMDCNRDSFANHILLIAILIITALVFSELAPLFKMDGQLVTRFGNHHFKLVNHFNPSI